MAGKSEHWHCWPLTLDSCCKTTLHFIKIWHYNTITLRLRFCIIMAEKSTNTAPETGGKQSRRPHKAGTGTFIIASPGVVTLRPSCQGETPLVGSTCHPILWMTRRTTGKQDDQPRQSKFRAVGEQKRSRQPVRLVLVLWGTKAVGILFRLFWGSSHSVTYISGIYNKGWERREANLKT